MKNNHVKSLMLVICFIFLGTLRFEAQVVCPLPMNGQAIENPTTLQSSTLTYSYDTAGNTGGVPDNTSDVEFYELILMEGDGTAPNAANAAASVQVTQVEADANGGIAKLNATGLLPLTTYTGYVRIKCNANPATGPFSSEAPTGMTWYATTFDNAQMIPDAPITINDSPDISIDVFARSEQEPSTVNPDALTAELFTCVDCDNVFTEGTGFGAQNLVPGRITATTLSASLDEVTTLGATVKWAARYTYTFTAGGNQTTRLIDSEIQSYVIQSPIDFDVATASDLEANGGNLPILLIEGTLDSDATIVLSVIGGTATIDDDFTFTNPTTVTIPAGTYDGTVATGVPISDAITINDDAVVEADETINLALNMAMSETRFFLGTTTASTYTITNDDYEISIASTIDGAEMDPDPDTNTTFTVSLSSENMSGADITVAIAYTGTATQGVDYETGPTSVTIPDGETSAVVTLVTTDDDLVEGNETIIATISNNQPMVNTTIATAEATANLIDDDFYEISIAQTTDGAEPDTDASFTVSLNTPNATGAAITVDVAYAGTATNGTDYMTGATSVAIPDGMSSAVITLETIDDLFVEGNETIEATISNNQPAANTSITTAMATANLADNDDYRITIEQTTEGAEPGTDASFTVSLNTPNATGDDITVDVAYAGTATNGTDYTTGVTSVSIPDGMSTAVITLETMDDALVEGTETIEATISNSQPAAITTIDTATATADLEDDGDAYEITIAQTTDGAEPDTDASFTVSLNTPNATGANITVDVAYAGTATNGTDYMTGATSVAIPNGMSSAIITLETIDDALVEGTETIEATISNSQPAASTTIVTAMASVNLADDGDVYEISIAQTTDGAEVGMDSDLDASFTVSLNTPNATGADITVDVAYAGTATNGTDYTTGVTSVAIPDGMSSAVITLETIDDLLVEGNETIEATISNNQPAANTSITTAMATANLADNDDYRITIEQTTDGAEPDTNASFTVSLNTPNATGNDITVDIAFDGTAAEGTDYETGPTTVSIADGEMSTVVTLVTTNDELVEDTETIEATISNNQPMANTSITTAMATANLTDEDNYDISIAQTTDGAEPDTNASFTLSLSTPNDSGSDITVDIGFSGTATEGTDYETGPMQVTFGTNEDTQVVTLMTLDDTIIEGNETIVADISNETGGAIVTPQATANIIDNDDYDITVEKTTDGAEPNDQASFRVRISPANNTGQAITVDVAYDGTATSGLDYMAGPSQVSIPDGQASASIVLEVIDDALTEGTEDIDVTISNPSDGIISQNMATAIIADNEGDQVEIEWIDQVYETNETDNSSQPMLLVDGTVLNDTDVALMVTITDLVENEDYTLNLPFTIPAGIYNGAPITAVSMEDILNTIDDNVVEIDGSLQFDIDAANLDPSLTLFDVNEDMEITATAVWTILDDDLISVQYNEATFTSTDEGTDLDINLEVSGADFSEFGTPSVVVVTVTGGTAENGTDYTFTTPVEVNIPNADYTTPVLFPLTVELIDDMIVEGNETVTFNVALKTEAENPMMPPYSVKTVLGDQDTTVLTITEDDAYDFIITKDTDGAEPDTNASFTVTVTPSNTSGANLTVDVAFSGTATEGEDYENGPTTVTIADGESTSEFTLVTIDDLLVEDTETIIATISNPSEGDISTDNAAANLADDDEYEISIAQTTDGAEPDTNASFTVSLNTPNTSGEDISVDIAFGGTATESSDYATGPTTVSIADGETSTVITLTTTDDDEVEMTETIEATISNPSTGSIAIAMATADLIDDDAYEFSIEQTTDGAEPMTNASFTVSVTPMNTSGGDLTVDIVFAGTATEGTDYETGPTLVVIPDGESEAVVTLVTIDDAIVEGTESIDTTISNPSEGTITTATATTNLIDDEVYSFSVNQTTDGAEPGTDTQFTVTLVPMNTSGGDLTVDIAFGGTATEGTDYETGPTMVTIADGESEALVTLVTLDDAIVEGTETIEATLSNPSEGEIATEMATANLEDDDMYDISIAQTTDGAEPDTNASFTVSVSPMNTSGMDITVDVAYAGTATNGTDYETGAMTATIADGESTAVITLVTTDDAEVEGTETIDVTISNPSQGTISTDMATANLVDDDAYDISIAQTTDGAEPNTNASFTVTLMPMNTSGMDITVDVAYAGTATNGADYETGAMTATIADGESTAVITLLMTDDVEVEGTETIDVTISNPSQGSISTDMATAYLADDDAYEISIAQTADGAEPATNAMFTVSLSTPNATGSDITLDIAYAGTATEGTDYETGQTTVTIAAGDSDVIVTLVTTDDAVVEGTETIEATISNASEGTITNATATTNLIDDEVYSFSINQTTDGSEPDSNASFTVTLIPMNTTGGDVTVDIAFAGTATEGTDYETGPMTVTIPNGESEAIVTLVTTDDNDIEGTETIEATISNPSVGEIATATATANLDDDDFYMVSIAQVTDGMEPSQNASFTVSVSPMNTSGMPITVDVAYEGTAINGTDYETGAMTISIPNGESSATLTLVTIDDELPEDTETIDVTISNPTSNTMISNASATADLFDDEVLGVNTFNPSNIKMYPNPASSIVKISIDVEEITIFNVSGKRVLSSNSNQVDVSILQAGVYLVKIITEYGTVMKRLIKE